MSRKDPFFPERIPSPRKGAEAFLPLLHARMEASSMGLISLALPCCYLYTQSNAFPPFFHASFGGSTHPSVFTSFSLWQASTCSAPPDELGQGFNPPLLVVLLPLLCSCPRLPLSGSAWSNFHRVCVRDLPLAPPKAVACSSGASAGSAVIVFASFFLRRCPTLFNLSDSLSPPLVSQSRSLPLLPVCFLLLLFAAY